MEAFERFLADPDMQGMTLAGRMEQCLKATWRTNEIIAKALEHGVGGTPTDPADLAPITVDIMGRDVVNTYGYTLPCKRDARLKPTFVGKDGTEWSWGYPQSGGQGREGWMRVAKPGEGPGAAPPDDGTETI